MLRARPADGGSATLILRAPAKVNLFLEVVGKRADGFHEVQTILQALDLSDRLTFEARRGPFQISCSTPRVWTSMSPAWWYPTPARNTKLP